MKRTLLLFLTTTTAMLGIQAQVVNEVQARQCASQFFKQMDAASAQTGSHRRNARPAATAQSVDMGGVAGKVPAFYVFNRGDDGGFVIVSGDSRTSASILAYSDHGSFNATAMPDNVRNWLVGYARQIEAVRNQSDEVGTAGVKAADGYGNVVVEPLITTQWNQNDPYNAKTPKMSGEHTPTGCVAVALAQIMNYHRWPLQGTGSIEYAWNNSYLDCDFSECKYDWDNIDVAQLMSDVGIACKMNYAGNGSSAYDTDAARALVRYFGYDKGMQFHVRTETEKYEWNDDEWEKMLREELDAQRPIYYSGGKRNGRFIEGHAFICDGYDDAGFFHFNFGWGGTDDGWYRVSMVDEVYVDVIEYLAQQCVFTHLQKDAGNPAWMNIIHLDNCYDYMYSFTSDYAETAYKFVHTATGDVYYSDAIEFPLKDNGYTNLYDLTGVEELYQGTIRDDYVKVHDMPDGTYKRYTVYRPKGSDLWQERNFNYCNANKKLAEEYVWVDMVNGKMTVSPSLEFSVGKWYYARVSEDEVAVLGMPQYQDSKIDNLVIPDTIEYRGMKYPVTDINLSYYHDYPALTLPKTLRTITQLKNSGAKLEIPSTVEKIINLQVPKATNLVLPSSLKYIGEPGKESSFLVNGTELTIPEGVVYVDNLRVNNFETVHMPASLQELGEKCMYNMSNLKTVTFADGCQLKKLPKSCFMLDSRLKNIVLPDGIERIGAECFENCGSVKEFAIPASVTKIDAGAFSGCTNLEHITFAEDGKLETIDGGDSDYDGTFFGCENLEYIEFPSSLKVFNDLFRNCGIIYADFSKTQITELGDADMAIFYGCHALETVLLPPTLTKMGNMFQDCEKVTSIVIPEGTEEIGTLGATNLKSLVIPASVKTFGGLSCNSSTIVICEGMTPPEGEGLADYIYASKLRNFTLYVPAGALQAYQDYEFTSGRYNHVYRIKVPIYEMASETAANVVTEAEGATVMGSTAEGAVVLPDAVGEVPVITIAANAFMGNATITSIDIPASVGGAESASTRRINGCRIRTAATGGIGEYAFAYCMKMDTVHVHWATPLDVDATVFRGIDLSERMLVVPDNTSSDYRSASVWKQFGIIIEETALGIGSPTNTLNAATTHTPVYDLLGRRTKQATRPGIYIQGGKKFMVK